MELSPGPPNPHAGSYAAVIDGVTSKVIARIEGQGRRIALNPHTNRIYTTSWYLDRLVVADGFTHEIVATVGVGVNPHGVAVNPRTNRIYVANLGYVGRPGDTVSVVDDATSRVVAEVRVGTFASAVAVSPLTNRVYVLTRGDQDRISRLVVIDGHDDAVVATLELGRDAWSSDVAVDTERSLVFVTNPGHDTVTVISDPIR